jgi:hypothetical protein
MPLDTRPITITEAIDAVAAREIALASLAGIPRPHEPADALLFCALGSALGQAAYWRGQAARLEAMYLDYREAA